MYEIIIYVLWRFIEIKRTILLTVLFIYVETHI